MRLKSIIVGLAAAGAAVRLFQNQKAKAGGSARPADTLSAAAARSLNPAEQLRDDNLAGSPIGSGTPLAQSGQGGRLFGSSSQQGETPVTAGVGDYARGA